MFVEKKELVTGGTGMIGRYLVELLIETGVMARIASIDDQSRVHSEAEFVNTNLLDIYNHNRFNVFNSGINVGEN
jgi:nucleoside-diphosphate-sugar epimerase